MIRLLSSMLALFIIAQVLGILTGTIIIRDLTENPYVSSMVVTTDGENPLNALFFLGYILLGAGMMIFFIRRFKLFSYIFRLMEFSLVASASSIVFYAFLRMFSGFDISTFAGVVIAIFFSAAKAVNPGLKNAAAILATAGVGVIFGISLGLVPLLIFLMMLSIYDFLSVFATHHMVEMANFIVKRDLAFTITARAPPEKAGQREQRIDLGTGDMIAPIMMEISLLSYSPIATLFVFFGASISLGAFLVLVWKKRMVLPALPPIVLGMTTSLLIGFLIGAY